MKKTLLTLALVATSVAAFAQGKVAFVNDSNHEYRLGTDRLPGDAAIAAGSPIPTTGLPSGVVLVAGLYAGTSSTSLTLQSTTTLLTGTGLPTPGRQATRNTVLTVPGLVQQWFQIAIWDSAVAAPGLSLTYVGYSPLFQATPGTSISYPSIMPGGPAASTLPIPAHLTVNAVPEPSSFALAGLGMASLLIFRRRK